MASPDKDELEELFLVLLRQGQSQKAGEVLSQITELSKGAIAEIALMLAMPETDEAHIDRYYSPYGLTSKRWTTLGRPKRTAHEDAIKQAWVMRVGSLMKAGKTKAAALTEVASTVKLPSGAHPSTKTLERYCSRYKGLLPG